MARVSAFFLLTLVLSICLLSALPFGAEAKGKRQTYSGRPNFSAWAQKYNKEAQNINFQIHRNRVAKAVPEDLQPVETEPQEFQREQRKMFGSHHNTLGNWRRQ